MSKCPWIEFVEREHGIQSAPYRQYIDSLERQQVQVFSDEKLIDLMKHPFLKRNVQSMFGHQPEPQGIVVMRGTAAAPEQI